MAKKRKKLKNEEMLQIEINNLKVDRVALVIDKLRAEGELNLYKQNDKIKAKSEELKNEQKRRKEYIESLKLDLGIETEKFSFNPETGEIENG